MFLLPDGTMWVQLANFAIFFAVLSVVFLRPVSQAIRKRREYINSLSADYEKYQGDANALRAQAEAERSAARRDAEATIGKARGQATNESAELSAQYAAKVQATVDAAHQTVANELEAARAGEAGLVAQLAELMVERTVGGGTR